MRWRTSSVDVRKARELELYLLWRDEVWGRVSEGSKKVRGLLLLLLVPRMSVQLCQMTKRKKELGDEKCRVYVYCRCADQKADSTRQTHAT